MRFSLINMVVKVGLIQMGAFDTNLKERTMCVSGGGGFQAEGRRRAKTLG